MKIQYTTNLKNKKKLTNDFIDIFSELQPRLSLQTPARVWTKIILRSIRCNFKSYKDNWCLEEETKTEKKQDQSKLQVHHSLDFAK
jgi:hypothetical protein